MLTCNDICDDAQAYLKDEDAKSEGWFAMNTIVARTRTAVVVAPEGITELVRGCDSRLVGHVEPLVRAKDVLLNCECIERIDAAGIAALISLYGSAQNTGHSFRVCNVRAHVKEILALVGLDRILVAACTGEWSAPAGGRLQQTAA
jgi:anti-anti-sigma factor